MKLSCKSFYIIIVFLAVSALFLSGCGEAEDEVPDGKVIAEVGNTHLTLEEVLARVPSSRLIQDSTAAVQEYRSQWVKDQVLANEARRLGIHESDAFNDALEQFEKQLLVQMLLDQYKQREGEPEVSRDQALRYYERHRDQFVLPEPHIRIRHMVADTFADANQARHQLLRGMDWQEIAERYAADREYVLRTATRFQPLSTALEDLPEMAQFLGVIGVSEVSPIRLIDGQYHFVQLVENHAEGSVPELDWTLSQIKSWIAVERMRTNINAYQQNLLRQAEAARQLRLHD